MVEHLDTERLLLRPMSIDDVSLLVELDSDPEVMRYINGGRPTSWSEMEATVRRSIGHRWIAVDRISGEFVGWFGLRATGDGEYELGYRLRRRAWGRGLATEASKALVEAAFAELGARRVWAQTMTVNVRSRRVMEACGLRHVRTFHLEWPEPIEGTEHGDVEYELTRDEWEATRSSRD